MDMSPEALEQAIRDSHARYEARLAVIRAQHGPAFAAVVVSAFESYRAMTAFNAAKATDAPEGIGRSFAFVLGAMVAATVDAAGLNNAQRSLAFNLAKEVFEAALIKDA